MKDEKNYEVGFEIRVVSNLIKRKVESILCQKYNINITGLQGRIAGYLYHNRDKEIFQKDLEEIFSIRRSTVTEILKNMEKNELITRESVDFDARLKKITLTQKALELNFLVSKDIKEIEALLKKDIEKEELEIFFNVLDKIKKNIE